MAPLLAKARASKLRDVTIVAGAAARVTQIRLAGDAAAIAARLEGLTA